MRRKPANQSGVELLQHGPDASDSTIRLTALALSITFSSSKGAAENSQFQFDNGNGQSSSLAETCRHRFE